MKPPGLYCYSCRQQIAGSGPAPYCCPVCGGKAFYRSPHPRVQTTGALMDRQSEEEQPPTDLTYGRPVRKRGRWGHGPV